MACVESKQLTEAERKTLENTARDSMSAVPSVALRGAAVREALRLLDAHAADRAALVAQVAELTRERDEALETVCAMTDLASRENAEVTRLTEALAAAERRATLEADAPALVARVLELEALARKGDQALQAAESECAALRAEVERLRAVAESHVRDNIKAGDEVDSAVTLLEAWRDGEPWAPRATDTFLAAQPATQEKKS